MIVSMNGPGGAMSVHAPAMPAAAAPEGAARQRGTEGCYDQVRIAQGPTAGDGRFQKELASRLVGEVRTANTTGDIQRIRDAVQTGTYQVDLAAIATRMMLGG